MSQKRLVRAAVVVGTMLLTVIVVGALSGSRSAADDLQAKSEHALRSAHIDHVHVAFHGREAELSGGTPDELDRAELIVEGIEGVRWADVVRVAAGPTAAPDTTPTLHIAHTDSGIAISGTVPDADAAASIKAGVAETFEVPVAGDLVINPAVGRAAWIKQLPDAFGDIMGVKALTLEIDGEGTLDLGGSIESRAGAEHVRHLLASALPGLHLVNRLDVRSGGLAEADAAVLNTSTVAFAEGRSALSVKSRATLDGVAGVLRRNTGVLIEVDAQAPALHPSDGERLSVARISAVKAYLVKAGVEPGRITGRALASHSRTTQPSAKRFRLLDFAVTVG